MHLDPEESVLAPVRSPTVTPDPVLGSGFLIETPSHNAELMVDLRIRVFLGVDAAVIALELLGDHDATANWASLEDLFLHVFGARRLTVHGNEVAMEFLPSTAVALYAQLCLYVQQ
jgi:hypothetical protein